MEHNLMHGSSVYRKWLTISAMLTLVSVVFFAGYLLGEHSPNVSVQAQSNQPENTDELFMPFWEAWTLLHENYVDPLDDESLMEGALTGMVNAVGDPHTDYMDPETFARMNESMSGAYEGIGATVRQDTATGGLELISIMMGSPAEAAGLRAGDQIVEVDGEDITALSQDQIISMVRGPAGTTVLLGILRLNEPAVMEFEVTRARISVPSVAYEILEGDIGYLRLGQFEFGSDQAMRDALEEMDANNLNGLILDVRGNPGGYLTTAVDVASAYISEGVILIERSPDLEYEHMARGNAIAPDVPMVILVDQGSASASELIAGALQDQGRATVVGTPTFGKGSVQTWRELSNGGGVRITISRWYTPNGNSVSEVGIVPDVAVSYTPDELDGTDNQLQAAIQVLQEAGEPRAQEESTPSVELE
jgi:carboxyl-terminal processing protease